MPLGFFVSKENLNHKTMCVGMTGKGSTWEDEFAGETDLHVKHQKVLKIRYAEMSIICS